MDASSLSGEVALLLLIFVGNNTITSSLPCFGAIVVHLSRDYPKTKIHGQKLPTQPPNCRPSATQQDDCHRFRFFEGTKRSFEQVGFILLRNTVTLIWHYCHHIVCDLFDLGTMSQSLEVAHHVLKSFFSLVGWTVAELTEAKVISWNPCWHVETCAVLVPQHWMSIDNTSRKMQPWNAAFNKCWHHGRRIIIMRPWWVLSRGHMYRVSSRNSTWIGPLFISIFLNGNKTKRIAGLLMTCLSQAAKLRYRSPVRWTPSVCCVAWRVAMSCTMECASVTVHWWQRQCWVPGQGIDYFDSMMISSCQS